MYQRDQRTRKVASPSVNETPVKLPQDLGAPRKKRFSKRHSRLLKFIFIRLQRLHKECDSLFPGQACFYHLQVQALAVFSEHEFTNTKQSLFLFASSNTTDTPRYLHTDLFANCSDTTARTNYIVGIGTGNLLSRIVA